MTNNAVTKEMLKNINVNKACGPDGISGKIFKNCSGSLSYPLSLLYRLSYNSGIVPQEWKMANVVPVYKKGSKSSVVNYRPISLLPICGKLLEKLIFNSLYLYLSSNNLITPNQSGFRSGDSCPNQLLFLVNEIHKAFEDPKSLELRAVFLDISKAFDKVWHEGLFLNFS